MPKETYYFSHDYHSRNDGEMVRLLMKKGVAGIGIFWCVVEMLYESGGYLNLIECERISFELRVDEKLVKDVISDYNLFKKDASKFWSESCLRRLQDRKELSNKNRKNALNRWERQKSDANALPPNTSGNAIKGKEKKGNEIKGNTLGGQGVVVSENEHALQKSIREKLKNVSKLKDQLTQEDCERLLKKYPGDENKKIIWGVLLDMENHKELTKKYTSVNLTLRNWLKKRIANPTNYDSQAKYTPGG